MNTRLNGNARVDDIKGHPRGEIRGLTKLVKITEDVRKFAAQQKLSEAEALQAAMEERSREFTQAGSEFIPRSSAIGTYFVLRHQNTGKNHRCPSQSVGDNRDFA